MKNPVINTIIALAILGAPAWAQTGPGYAHVPQSDVSDCEFRIVPWAMEFVDRALEAQAWAVLLAAQEYAVDNDGNYPADVAAFIGYLPRGERMENLLTGKQNVPCDAIKCPHGAITYRAIDPQGQPVGCEIVVLTVSGDPIVLLSDEVWRDHLPPIALNTEAR